MTPSISGSACGSPSEETTGANTGTGNTAARCDSCLTWWPENLLLAVMQGAFPVLRLCPRCRDDRGGSATDCMHRDPDCLRNRKQSPGA